MKCLLRGRKAGLRLLVIILVSGLAGCTPDATAEIISPELGAQLAAKNAASGVIAQPTPELLRLANLTEDEIVAGLPAEIASAIISGNPDNGQALALNNGCVGCHSLDPEQQMVGPTWYDAGDQAANRQPDVSPGAYLYNSIVHPNQFVVEGYPANVMPQNYGDILSEQELAVLVSYLLAQHEQ